MTEIDLQLHSLLGDKTLSFGCKVIIKDEYIHTVVFDRGDRLVCTPHQFDSSGNLVPVMKCVLDGYSKRIIGHEPQLHDFHKWLNEKTAKWVQEQVWFSYHMLWEPERVFLYDSSKSLLSQSDETKRAIIDFVTSNS